MITLAMETSTVRGSVAISEDGRVIFSERFAADRSLGSTLFPCLQRAVVTLGEKHIDRIAVGLGPGSYSGVRIAIAAAVGLELTGGAEALGIPSILALETDAEKYLTTGDARRASFYFAEIDRGKCLTGPLLLDAEQLKAAIDTRAGLPVYGTEPMDAAPALEICFPSAERLARLAEAGLGIVARGDLEPIYLRDPHITQAREIR